MPAAFVIRAVSGMKTEEPCVSLSGCAARYVLRLTVTDLPAIAMPAEVEGARRAWRWQAGTSCVTDRRQAG
ncbi:MAG: hypothetical protein KAU38_06190 [Desulfobacterales bacterium]|nr:hypothetical protein [Desulfobacterales bacterium]